MMIRIYILLLFLLGLQACVSKVKEEPVISKERALAFAQAPTYRDDLDIQSMVVNIDQHLAYLKKQNGANEALQFGPTLLSANDYVSYLEAVKQTTKSGKTATVEFLQATSDCYKPHGNGRSGEAFMTSYFDPVITASRRPTRKHSRAIYQTPKDMVLIQLAEFQKSFPHWSILPLTEQKSPVSIARGRLVKSNNGQPANVVPYWTREEIDSQSALKGQRLELAYADPLDVFVMQIQGSGTLKFTNGQIKRVGYAAQNGHPYSALGIHLKEVIPPEQMSLQTIEQVMRQLPPERAQELMNRNKSYVFFSELKGEPLTTIGTFTVPGRTIATDRQYFPKGVLAYLEFEKPIFSDENSIAPVGWDPVGRFVFDQDTGGAIRGTGRLDLYWGRGAEAKQSAGVIKQWSRLCYVVPKSDWRSRTP